MGTDQMPVGLLHWRPAMAPLMAAALWLSAFDRIVRRGQAISVRLIVLLMYAAVER
ncbi:MAG: hypothetical protein JO334_09195 [Verrucomicrobia bacterium]|nr:hypothetical protein [Verrucomicrobiota bacterium]